ncbi:MAG: hypothetical protein Q9190_004878 [Brigantiaea leucoxantha]
MAPIRLAFIGLSPTSFWASAAHLPYLKSAKDKYVIKALCNSSVESAQKAISKYDLPETTKAYGDPHDLAKDPEVDLIVCCTRVDVHYKTIKPCIEGGKDVYVEWPLGSNLQQATELAALAKEKGVKTMVGLQGRVSPVMSKLDSLIKSETIGEIKSSSVVASGMLSSRDTVPERMEIFMDKAIGGNLVTIGLGHTLDYVHALLSEYSSLTSTLHLTHPLNTIIPSSASPSNPPRQVTSNVPDLISLSGTLTSPEIPLQILYRRGSPFKNTPGLSWSILGSTGEFRVTAPGPAINAFDSGTTIELHDFKKDEVSVVEWERERKELPVPGQNIGGLYERFWAGGKGGGYPGFEDAVVRHREIEEIYRSDEEGRRVSYV